MLIDADWNFNHAACYSINLLNELYDHPHTLLEVLTRQDGEWKKVPVRDRLWVFWRAVDKETINKVLTKIVTRAIINHALRCRIPQVEEWAKNWLNGTNRTTAAAHAARTAAAAAVSAAADASATAYAYAAAYAAANAAYAVSADAAAAVSAVSAAAAHAAYIAYATQQDEYNKQLQDAIDVLKEGELMKT